MKKVDQTPKSLCYVCKSEIETRTESGSRTVYFLPRYDQVKHIIDPVYVGNDTFRHRLCEPGGARWMRTQADLPKRKRSELYRYFELEGKI